MIDIQIDSRAIERALLDLGRHVDDMTPAMTAIGLHVRSLIDETFINEADPYGNPWQELSDVTVSRRRQNTSGILKDTGHLQSSFTSNPGRHEVQIGTNEIYGKTHQFGAAQGQYGKNRRNTPIPWGNVPARPFFPNEAAGCPHDWEQDVLDIIRRHIEAAI